MLSGLCKWFRIGAFFGVIGSAYVALVVRVVLAIPARLFKFLVENPLFALLDRFNR